MEKINLIELLIQTQMKNLKNQKELLQNLPPSSLSCKYTKLSNRFACRTKFQNTKKLNPLVIDTQTDPLRATENISFQLQNRVHNTKQKSFTNNLDAQRLQYFIGLNTKIKDQNQKLRKQLQKVRQDLQKSQHQLRMSEEKAKLYQSTISQSERKITRLMALAAQLSRIVKSNFLETQNSDFYSQCQQKIQTNNSNDKNLHKKKLLLRELDKIQLLNSQSTFNNISQQILTLGGFNSLESAESKLHSFLENGSIGHLSQERGSYKKLGDLISSLELFQTDMKDMKTFQKTVEGVISTFQGDNLFQRDDQMTSSSRGSNLKEFGRYILDLVKNSLLKSSRLGICSGTSKVSVQPTCHNFRLFSSLKESFDHQIYLLENEKMAFLQYKNKRLLKFVYECSGCERYEQMLNEMFRIIREGYKELKCKIAPEIKNKQEVNIII